MIWHYIIWHGIIRQYLAFLKWNLKKNHIQDGEDYYYYTSSLSLSFPKWNFKKTTFKMALARIMWIMCMNIWTSKLHLHTCASYYASVRLIWHLCVHILSYTYVYTFAKSPGVRVSHADYALGSATVLCNVMHIVWLQVYCIVFCGAVVYSAICCKNSRV